jgi:hypothetical protein
LLQFPPLTPSPETLAASCEKLKCMRKELEFIIDTIEIVPKNSICHIQDPNIENVDFLELCETSKYNWAQQIVLNSENKEKFKTLLLRSEIEGEFQNIIIEKEEKKIFEGFDGMVIGEISEILKLPNWYVKKYIKTKYCNIAKDW